MKSIVRVSCLVMFVAMPALARAQQQQPSREVPQTRESPVVGEKYHIEASGSFWNPAVFGQVSSDQFGISGSSIDFVNDLGFSKTQFKDVRLVLRPSKQSRFRIQYTPIVYSADSALKRDIIFNGIQYHVALPITSEVDWKVLRLGYEYDFVYLDRGFVGLLLEARMTKFSTHLMAPGITPQFTSAQAPLPAIGFVGRAYPHRNVAINFEMTGFKLPDALKNYGTGNWYDWDINGTVNFTRYVGAEIGWRRLTTQLQVKTDSGNMKFQGMYFGGVVRY